MARGSRGTPAVQGMPAPGCLPQWIGDVNDSHQYMKGMQSVLDEHLQLSPRRWGGAGLATMCWNELEAALSQAFTGAKCDGCGKSSLALKRCATCQQASYCRWV